MKLATRKLMKMRPGSRFVENIEYRPAKTKRFGNCQQNAIMEMRQKNKDRHRVDLVSGWMVGRYDKDTDTTEVGHHFWNYDRDTDTYYDTTDFGSDLTLINEYVIDMEITEKMIEQFKPGGQVYFPCSLLIKSDRVIFGRRQIWTEEGYVTQYDVDGFCDYADLDDELDLDLLLKYSREADTKGCPEVVLG